MSWGSSAGSRPGRWVGGLSTVLGGAAAADPVNAKNAFFVELECENGQTHEVVVNGNGDYTPAHILGSTGVLVPFAFGEFTGTVTFPDGTTETFTEPGSSKAAASRQRGLVNCT
ncbi:MAG: hypothetical protein WKF43_12880, partial [Acidimicrobiales bacterium]